MYTLNELIPLIEKVKEKGFFKIENCNLCQQDLIKLSKSISSNEKNDSLLDWGEGPVMKMNFKKKSPNYLFSQEQVPFHWDGAFHKEPRFLVFYCTNSSGEGGESLFCDTRKILESLNKENKKELSSLKVSYKTEKKAHYGGEISVSVLQKHPEYGDFILRFAQEVKSKLNPVERKVVQGENRLCDLLDSLLYHKDYIYEHRWKKNDLILVDNFYYLHGRRALGKNIERSFLRVQVL